MQQTEEIRACRACLAIDCELHDLEENGLLEKLKKLTSLRMVLDDRPRHICNYCRALLLKAYRFRSKCLEMDNNIWRDVPMSYIRHINKTKQQILSRAETLVDSFGGENEERKEFDGTASSLGHDVRAMKIEVTVKEEPADIDDLQHVDGYVTEPIEADVNCHNKVLDIVIDPISTTQLEEHNVKDDLFAISPKREIEDPFIAANEIHESSMEDTIAEVNYLDDCDTNNATDIGSNVEESDETTSSQDNTMLRLKSVNTIKKSDNTSRKKGGIYKRNTMEAPNYLKHIPLTTLQDLVKLVKGRRKSFYKYVLDKYHYKKAEGNEESDIWDVDHDIPDNEQDEELEKQHEIANRGRNACRKLFYRSLKEKYRNSESDTINYSFKLDLCGKADITPKETQPFEQKYQMRLKCFRSNEEKICNLESQKHRAGYLNMEYKCGICYVGYQQKDLYTRHMLLHDPASGPHECEVCHRRYTTRKRLMAHVPSHNYLYTCLVSGCGRIFVRSDLAKRHSENHKGAQYPCKYCDKIFLRYKTRTEHYRNHHCNVTCPLCHWPVRSGGAAMKLHRSKMHPEVFPCSGCGTEFASLSALARHGNHCGVGGSRTAGGLEGATGGLEGGSGTAGGVEGGSGTAGGVEGSKGWACGACGETAATKQELQQHIETHRVGRRGTKLISKNYYNLQKSGSTAKRERPKRIPHLMCEICSKTFYASTILRQHMNSHTGEKPFTCAECPKSFGAKSTLKHHMAVHSASRPFPCHECGKTFYRLSNFQRHQLVHTGERPFGCDICGKTYQSKSSIQIHIKTAHMNEPWPKRVRIAKRKNTD